MNDIIYGIRPIIEAINSGKTIDKVLVASNLQGELFRTLAVLIAENKIPIQYVPAEKIEKLAPNNNQGVVAYTSAIAYQSLEAVVSSIFEKGKIPLIIVLDRITDVRNFGAIVRTAECAGVDAVVVPSHGAARINQDAIKTSAGAILSMNICKEDNLKTTIHFLKASGIKVIAATEKSTINYTDSDFSTPTAILMGSEEDGVSKEFLKLCDEKIAIPILGNIDSLNVSVATGVLLYEVVRQRNKHN